MGNKFCSDKFIDPQEIALMEKSENQEYEEGEDEGTSSEDDEQTEQVDKQTELGVDQAAQISNIKKKKKKKKKKKAQKVNKSFSLEHSKAQQLVLVDADKCEQKIDVTIDQVRFWSTFDAGNLKRVVRQEESDNFSLWLGRDCGGRMPPLMQNGNVRQWFYFKVHNQSQQSRKLTFTIENLEPKQFSRIWKADRDIFIKIQTNKKGEGKWVRHQIEDLTIPNKQTMKITFQVTFPANSTINFAQCIPWSYTHNQNFLSKKQILFKQNPDMIFHRELLCYSFEGRRVELVTITMNNKQLDKQEDYYGDPKYVFPQQKPRPYLYDKPYLFITCRVHAGEQPSSYMMKGIIEFFETYQTNKDAKAFLKNFVLVLIPMLNPDGVYRGHYRLDALGYDPNRVYNRTYKKGKFTPQYASLETGKYYGERVKFFVDLHSHSQIANSFMYTNKHPEKDQQVEILLLPTLLTYFLSHFSFNPKTIWGERQKLMDEEIEGQFCERHGSKYTDNQFKENLDEEEIDWHASKLAVRQWKLKPQLEIKQVEESKDQTQFEALEVPNLGKQYAYKYVPGFRGVAKCDMFYATAINLCYTLESNYRYYYIRENGKLIRQKFAPRHFEEIGRSLILSALEMYSLRSKRSILPSQGYDNIDSVRNAINQTLG